MPEQPTASDEEALLNNRTESEENPRNENRCNHAEVRKFVIAE